MSVGAEKAIYDLEQSNYDYAAEFISKMKEYNVGVILTTNGCNSSYFIDRLSLNGILLLQHIDSKTVGSLKHVLLDCEHIVEVLYNESTIKDISMIKSNRAQWFSLKSYSIIDDLNSIKSTEENKNINYASSEHVDTLFINLQSADESYLPSILITSASYMDLERKYQILR